MTKLFLIVALAFTASAFADHEHPKVEMPKEFEALKKLVGNWEGTTTMEGKEMKATVSYRLTSADTAIEERLGEGTPNEMVTMYYKSGNKLGATHYCALGNQPHMEMKNADAKTISFELKKPVGIKNLKEMHMHSIAFTFTDDKNFEQKWTNWINGKPGEVAVFNFKRKN